MVQPRVGQGSVQFALRLPVALRDRIKAYADENGRSMNSEIIEMLEQALSRADLYRMELGLPPLREMDEDDRNFIALALDDIERRRAAKEKLLTPTDFQEINQRLERIEKKLDKL